MADLNKNKAMIPMDCSDVLYKKSIVGFIGSNFTTTKNIDISIPSSVITSTLRPFELAGEFYINCSNATVSYAAKLNTIYYLKCNLKFDSNIANRLQFIRFAFKPGVTFKNTGSANCKFGIDVYIYINGVEKQTLKFVNENEVSPNGSYTTGIYKLIYDIENDSIEEDIYELGLDLVSLDLE